MLEPKDYAFGDIMNIKEEDKEDHVKYTIAIPKDIRERDLCVGYEDGAIHINYRNDRKKATEGYKEWRHQKGTYTYSVPDTVGGGEMCCKLDKEGELVVKMKKGEGPKEKKKLPVTSTLQNLPDSQVCEKTCCQKEGCKCEAQRGGTEKKCGCKSECHCADKCRDGGPADCSQGTK